MLSAVQVLLLKMEKCWRLWSCCCLICWWWDRLQIHHHFGLQRWSHHPSLGLARTGRRMHLGQQLLLLLLLDIRPHAGNGLLLLLMLMVVIANCHKLGVVLLIFDSLKLIQKWDVSYVFKVISSQHRIGNIKKKSIITITKNGGSFSPGTNFKANFNAKNDRNPIKPKSQSQNFVFQISICGSSLLHHSHSPMLPMSFLAEMSKIAQRRCSPPPKPPPLNSSVDGAVPPCCAHCLKIILLELLYYVKIFKKSQKIIECCRIIFF